jgi:hypothetical protein
MVASLLAPAGDAQETKRSRAGARDTGTILATSLNTVRDFLRNRNWTVEWTTHKPDSQTIVAVGNIVELPGSEIVIANVLDAVVGSVSEKTCPNDHCAAIEAAAGVDVRMFEIDSSIFAPDGSPFLASFVDAGPACIQDDGSEITALVFYTTAAQKAVGSETLIKAYIRYAEATTNVAFTRSGLSTKLRVVGMEPLEFAEAGLSTGTILQVFRDAQVIQKMRDDTYADVVFLIVNGGTECGRAHLMPNDPAQFKNFHSSAYAVVRWSCIRCNWSFTHELGHLLGACHDQSANDCTTNATFNFAHAQSSAAPYWMTVNASKDLCQDCARLNEWSTAKPGVFCAAAALGGPTEDNARLIKDTVIPVAKFRCRP